MLIAALLTLSFVISSDALAQAQFRDDPKNYSATPGEQGKAEFVFEFPDSDAAVERMLTRFSNDNGLKLTVRRFRAATHTSLLAMLDGSQFGRLAVSNAGNAHKYYCSYYQRGVPEYPETILRSFEERFKHLGGHLLRELIGEDAVRSYKGD